MRIKTAAARFGNALVEVANELHNQGVRNEIDRIDSEQAALRTQLTRLEEARSEQTAKLI
jgi:hypothetical protein